jgi:uncharacterized Tic20 family protein
MTQEENKKANPWALFCHLGALSGYIGVPFGNIVLPLVIWLIKKDEFPFVDEQGKESVNFQISVTIYAIIAGLLCFIFIGFVLLPVILIAGVVLVIIASVRVNKGEGYRYPLTLRLIK